MTFLAFIAAAAGFVPANCSLLAARYILKGAPDVSAKFEGRAATQDYPSPVYFVVHSRKIEKTYYFVPTETGSGVGVKTHLELMSRSSGGVDNESDLEPIFRPMDMYIVSDRNFVFNQSFAPTVRGMAPAHILVPGLQELMWYGDFNKREYVPLAFFNLTACAP